MARFAPSFLTTAAALGLMAGAAGFVILALALVAMLRRQAPALQVKRISE